MKFRKKPVVIEAHQYIDDLFEAFDWAEIVGHSYGTSLVYDSVKGFLIKTLEGELTVSPGDWIIKGISGELYPCKPDIFEKTYEPVDEPEGE